MDSFQKLRLEEGAEAAMIGLMLGTAIVAVVFFGLLMGLMALGVMLSGKRLRGSCGGNPDSSNCGCSPAKKAVCRTRSEANAEPEEDLFSGPPLTAEHLAPPGEKRLIQLQTGRR